MVALYLPGKTKVGKLSVKKIEEKVEAINIMWSDHKRVVHISPPIGEKMGEKDSAEVPKPSMTMLVATGERGEPIAATEICSVY